MNWISEHLQLILAVAGALAYWLSQRREAEAKREAEKNPPPASLAEADADDPFRAEKVREEIRRKIAERRGGAPLPEPVRANWHAPYTYRRFQSKTGLSRAAWLGMPDR